MMQFPLGIRALGFNLLAACLLASCASNYSPQPGQPDLTQMAEPYAARLRAQNISRVESPPAGGAFVKVMSQLGPFDIRNRPGALPTPFVVVVGASGIVVDSSDYTPPRLAQYKEAIDWTLSEVLRRAPQSEADLRRLQNDSGGGRGGGGR